MLLLADQFARIPVGIGRIRRLLLEKLREEVNDAGAGLSAPHSRTIQISSANDIMRFD
jgi:hypothetical protein